MPCKVKFRIAHSLLLTHILYGLEIYSGCNSSNLRRVQLIFNRIIRYVFKLRLHDHVSVYAKSFLRCSFHDFVKIRVLLALFHLIKFNINPIFAQSFQFSRSTRNSQLIIPRIFNSVYERSFLVRACRLYNELPFNLRSFDVSVIAFKQRLVNSFNQ